MIFGCISSKNASTLISIIPENIFPGIEVPTDGWKSYVNLEFLVVYPSKGFKSLDGIQINRIETMWGVH
ncbi:hypothetical protein HZS_2240 [Henneguya salminicola]|nr:hypothetical protein HZS_2240 [Henneguya salminicola]